MRSLTILVDMDDVLENFCEEWIKYLNEQHGTNVKHSDITEWEINKFFPTITKQELYAPIFELAFWERVKPLPGAVSTVLSMPLDLICMQEQNTGRRGLNLERLRKSELE